MKYKSVEKKSRADQNKPLHLSLAGRPVSASLIGDGPS